MHCSIEDTDRSEEKWSATKDSTGRNQTVAHLVT